MPILWQITQPVLKISDAKLKALTRTKMQPEDSYFPETPNLILVDKK